MKWAAASQTLLLTFPKTVDLQLKPAALIFLNHPAPGKGTFKQEICARQVESKLPEALTSRPASRIMGKVSMISMAIA